MDRQDAVALERVHTPIPGPRTRELIASLQRYESRGITFVDERFPVFWQRAAGATVTDVDGNRYIDLTAAFGVAGVGHSNPTVASAIAEQSARLMHAMGDVHPADVKVSLLQRLAAITPGSLEKAFLTSTGAEAVEAALKTAMLATGKSRFAAFRGGYHGLSLGALAVTAIDRFRDPFAGAVAKQTLFLDYPRDAESLGRAMRALSERNDLAAVIIEPIQGRGGCVIPPDGYLRQLRELCVARGMLLIFDEIYTGFGRTGTMFACEHERVVPDILCIGKAMANGFPIAAAIATAAVMDAWQPSAGEALHTSTYLGNPMGCAAALATIDVLQAERLVDRCRELGAALGARLQTIVANGKAHSVRGRGLMWGIVLADAAHAQRVAVEALHRGVIVLQSGAAGNVLSVTPPLIISQLQLFRAIEILEACL